MAGTGFAQRWDLDPARRDALNAIIDGVAAADQMIAGVTAIKANLLARAQLMAEDLIHEAQAPARWDLPVRAIAADIAVATNASDRTLRARMEDATVLISKFPATYSALCEGRISPAHATVIVDEGERLDDAHVRSRYERVVVERAAETTPGRLRPIAQAVAEELEPIPFVERHEAALEQRRTWVDDLPQGVSHFNAIIESVRAHGIQDMLTQMGLSIMDAGPLPDDVPLGDERAAATSADTRTLQQLRADAFVDSMLAGAAKALSGDGAADTTACFRPRVQITIPVDTLLGIGDEPAFLAGHGPVSPEVARRLAGRTHTWARLFADPDTGCLRTVDTYVPTADQKRFLAARDEHCRFPGCRQPVYRCDLDHTVAYAEGGRTEVGNLAPLCRSHHVLKHNSDWDVEQGFDGLMAWISPTGRRKTDVPARTVRFVAAIEASADPDPPPEPAWRDPAPF
ncbi:HNH endonuclease [Microbacterium paludicola]|uniref:HNH endonuclease n=1 Tax=Microbacterium paludicola TaxID=300019 RepID=A0A4Y9FYK5_9MICO|nr:HNH endonuclease signature motif containing protein [Microbacterium paludicola]MBF0816018.1 DUF222 domain-containing protein [Microbacterium paludicola]TFU33337.1 HNH endonuclease [Microbacterium paludicola]